MKKILVLLLVLVLGCSILAGCEYLPEGLQDTLAGLGIGGTDNVEHEHDFKLTATKAATCTVKGKETYTCDCGEKKVVELPSGHAYQLIKTEAPTCTKPGNNKYMCDNCGGQMNESFGDPTGHALGAFVEYSRLIVCANDNCSYGVMPEGNGKYTELIVFNFTDEDVARFDAIYAELDAIITAADAYDADLHSYDPGSDNHAAYLVMEAKYEELYDVLEYIVCQYQIASLNYDISLSKDDANILDNISKVRTDLVGKFYSFSQPIYDSMYRDYYYEGMTPEEIKAFIFESDTVSNPEYKALVDENNEIEIAFSEIEAPEVSDEVPELYAKFVANNNKMAQILGYENYLEYAYENIYDRDYTPADVKVIVENVKKNIAPVYNKIYGYWENLSSNIDYNTYEFYTGGGFFNVYEQNNALNNYIDTMEFEGNGLTFSDVFNSLLSDGNCFRGIYSGAYVTTLYGLDLPIAYFGNGAYSNFFTVAHEFGHYMNEVYGGGEWNQSYDLLEMHSQGNETLFLAYLNLNPGTISKAGLDLLNVYQNLNTFYVIMNALAVDTFEQAVYTNTYEGTYADEIMADGQITYDEYDLLYEGIVKDFGASKYMSTEYWRYVTIQAPCYYVSYAVSAVSVLQLYPMAMEDYDAASAAYLKLFSYVDEYENGADYMTTAETLEYAGLYSFTDPELYVYIGKYFSALFS